jgi:hypothetical protein
LGIVALIIWIAIAFWPGRVARRKGHSFFGFFVLSLLFFPRVLNLAYVVRDRRLVIVRQLLRSCRGGLNREQTLRPLICTFETIRNR